MALYPPRSELLARLGHALDALADLPPAEQAAILHRLNALVGAAAEGETAPLLRAARSDA
jgi:hypothetical protein